MGAVSLHAGEGGTGWRVAEALVELRTGDDGGGDSGSERGLEGRVPSGLVAGRWYV